MTSLDLQNELHSQLDTLTVEKKELEAKLVAIRNLIRTSGWMPNEKYKQCIEIQNRHTADIAIIEGKRATLKAQLRNLSAAEKAKTLSVDSKIEVSAIEKLSSLRDEYQEFSADSTRVGSMRTMAAEFVIRLNPIIKEAIGERA